MASPNGRVGFVANFNSAYISVVDLVIGAEIRRIPGILARSVALNDAGTQLVATMAGDKLAVIDTQTFAVTTLNLPPGTNPQQVIVSGDRAYINARGFLAPQPVVVVDLTNSTIGTVTGTAIGFGPPKGGAMRTPDGRVLILRSGSPNYTLIVIDPANSDDVRTVSLRGRDTQWRRATHGHSCSTVPEPIQKASLRVDLTAATPTLVPGANTPLAFLPRQTRSERTGSFRWPSTANSTRLVVVGASYSLSPKISTFDVNQLLMAPATTTPVMAFDLQHMIRDVHLVPAVPDPYPPVPKPAFSIICAPAIPLQACPKTITNDAPATLRILGANFQPGALVRVGNAPPCRARS